MRAQLAIVLFLTICWYPEVDAQSIDDISGRWSGSVNVPLSQDLLGEYYFTKKGLTIHGHVKLKSINGLDSSKYKFAGTIKNNVIEVLGTEFVYKAPGACLAVTELEYSRDGNLERLKGNWRGNMSLKTCPPGLSGNIELARVIDNPVVITTPSKPSISVDQNDLEGNALMDALRKRQYYALLIGINEYDEESITDLDHPVADAKELKRILESHYTFKPENIKLLSNPTRTEIIEAFDVYSKKITELDNFLIFYAGHGIWDDLLNQGYWLPSDAHPESKAQWLSNSTIRDYIGGIPTKHTLLVTDACFSGGIFKQRSITFGNSRAMLEMYKLKSRKAMTSGALTTVPDKSVFLSYLTKKLVENESPLLSADELFRALKIAVINNSPNGQVPQYGAIGQVGDEGGEFIFLKFNNE